MDSASEPVRHTVAFAGASNHYIEVESVFPAQGLTELEVYMASWTPGSYAVRDYARHIEELRAHDATGAALSVAKTRKNRWLVSTGGADEVVLSYRLYAGSHSVRGNFADTELAVLNGASTFLTPVESVARPHEVKLDLRPGWAGSYTGLPAHRDGRANHYVAANFDVLVDSPMVLGTHHVRTFRVDGRAHRLVDAGADAPWDHDRALAAIERIVATQHGFWGGELPYGDYTFLNVANETRGGLEHLNSTLMMTSRFNTTKREDFVKWMSLASHEFFHVWNVKRLRPTALGPFDYETEVHTKSLWVSEGLTSYYDDLLLRRAGLTTEVEYLKQISKAIGTLQLTPGRQVQPLETASYDAWIKHYQKDENQDNSAISYYTKGAVVGFLLDARIRSASQGQRSLDDVMRLAYERYSGERGFSPAEFRAVCSEVAGIDVSEFLRVALETTDELDFAPALEYYGLRFSPEPPPDEDEDKDDAASEDPTAAELAAMTPAERAAHDEPKDAVRVAPDAKPAWLGAELSGARVKEVKKGTPAYSGGLSAGDELLAVDGQRTGDVDELLAHYAPGAEVELLIARRARVQTLRVVLGVKPLKTTWELERHPDATEAQRKRRRDWLRVDGAEAVQVSGSSAPSVGG